MTANGRPSRLALPRILVIVLIVLDGKCTVAYELRGEGLLWLIGAWYVCMLHRRSSCSLAWAVDGREMRPPL